MKSEIQEYLEGLTIDDCRTIIKYGLRGSDAPEGVTVDDIFVMIGCLYIENFTK